MNWGAIPDWVSAVATAFALVFAVLAVVSARRTHAIESRRDVVNEEARRTQEAFARRSQAALVSAWWGRDDTRWGGYVRNSSEAPVYQAHLTVIGPDDAADGAKVHFPVMPPDEKAAFHPIAVPPGGESARRVILSFTDAAGVRWMRNRYGRLTELSPTLRIKTERDYATVLGRFDEDFLATYGVTVTYELAPDEYPEASLIEDVRGPSGPDAMIVPHDWIGDLADLGVIEPTVLSDEHRDAFPPWTLTALTLGRRLYGLPTTVDTVALIRNTDLVPDAPATFEDLIEAGDALKADGRVAETFAVRVGGQGEAFQLWPLFASAGGSLFARPDGLWDPRQMELNTAGSVAAFERLRSLGEAGTGHLRRSMGSAEAFELFTTGRTPYLLSTSDGLRYARHAGVPLAVSAVPPFASGGPAIGLSSVHGLLMSGNGVNKAIAHDLFADYLSRTSVMTALSEGIVGPAALPTPAMRDPAIEEYRRLAEACPPMPTTAQMGAVWPIVGAAQAAVIGGADAAATAAGAAAAIEALW